MMRFVVLFTISLVLFWGCKKDPANDAELGLEYYPISVNSYKIYDVDCLVYNNFTLTVDTYSFEMKDVVESELKQSSQHGTEYRMERYIRPNTNKNWEIEKAWMANKTNFRAVEQLENLREVKLTFPVKTGISWDANAENTLEKEEYSVENSAIDTSINGITYNQVYRVDHFYITDPLQINTEISYEHYAPNVGLVNKYEKFVKRFTTGIPGDPVIDSGYEKSVRIKLSVIE